MFISGPWDVGNLRDRLTAEQQKTWSTAPLPAPDIGSYPGLSMAGGSSLVITKHSEKRAAAAKLIQFLSRPDIQIRFSELSGDLPARRSAWQVPALRDDPKMKAFRAQLDRTRAMPALPEAENIVISMSEFGQLAARGQMSPRDAAHALDAKVEAMLEKRRWVVARSHEVQR
jgi:multiple sugar transport system substrate-binding protein